MRGIFAYEIYKQMQRNKRIVVITGDLGYGMWDLVRRQYPKRFFNVGAAEQAMLGLSVGLALGNRIPIVYSITPFLLYRPFETIRNYIDHENIPVKLIGSGRDKDYKDDGISHWCEDEKQIMDIFTNIVAKRPKNMKEIPSLVKDMLKSDRPWYVNLRR